MVVYIEKKHIINVENGYEQLPQVPWNLTFSLLLSSSVKLGMAFSVAGYTRDIFSKSIVEKI